MPRRQEKGQKMFRTVNANKERQLKPKAIVFTILWLLLFTAALLLIAFGGHI
jgi:hypothetical protein